MRTLYLTLALLLLIPAYGQKKPKRIADAANLEQELIQIGSDGLRRINTPNIPKEHQNPWPKQEEEVLAKQVHRYLEACKEVNAKGNTYFVNEKK